jgi:hypothetical protein
VPTGLSARLCASLQIDGDWTTFLFGIPVGHLKGRVPALPFLPLRVKAEQLADDDEGFGPRL